MSKTVLFTTDSTANALTVRQLETFHRVIAAVRQKSGEKLQLTASEHGQKQARKKSKSK